MDREQHIAHRGQWGVQRFPNSFETFRLSGGGVEADVMLLNDGKTLAVVHPGDFETTDAQIEKTSPKDFAKFKVKNKEQTGGAAPFFREYVAGCYDRGVQPFFEIKGSDTKAAVTTARKVVETIKDMQTEGTFKIQGREHPELLNQMGVHSISPEAVTAAKRALEETGVRLNLGFSWLSNLEYAKQNQLAAEVLRFCQKDESWEESGLRAAKELGCDYIFFVEPSRITNELVEKAHTMGIKLYVYIRPAENSEAVRDKVSAMKVDGLLY